MRARDRRPGQLNLGQGQLNGARGGFDERNYSGPFAGGGSFAFWLCQSPAGSKPGGYTCAIRLGAKNHACGSRALHFWEAGPCGSNSHVTGERPPYHCALEAGSSLPDGLQLSDDCVIAGAPHHLPTSTSEISPPFTIIVSDSAQPQNNAYLGFSITTDNPKPVLSALGGTCTANEQCNIQVATATGGTEPYTFSLGSMAGGSPPMGMAGH